MDPGHTLPSVLTGQSLQPPVQRQSSPSVASEHGPDGGGRSQTHSLADKPLLSSSEGSPPRDRNDPHPDFEPIFPQTPVPARGRDGHMIVRGLSRRSAMGPISGTSGLDYLVPVVEKPHLCTLGERIRPTIDNAKKEREQYAIKAKWTSYALNIAIGLQVLLGALTTGIAAALSGKQTSIAISLLGGMSTMVASYLARARGSNEPELSITRVKDLDQFLRDCDAFVMDHGHEYGSPENKLDDRLRELRRRFEELLGNADGQRKLSPPV
ncbi:hypothetical protein AZE42_04927 [Rhizopogon vesiculosus]|uniref:SMODS and SLOG-associating 2TM effector domain-containing protein n=1 Tax=Rhizopogon vesiculosus TaxID=180088 RepID=A0A1J8QCL3_9AGAM|nr:hypothetical protein AZE42_04927 [Rhizopogon vesiculosus]